MCANLILESIPIKTVQKPLIFLLSFNFFCNVSWPNLFFANFNLGGVSLKIAFDRFCQNWDENILSSSFLLSIFFRQKLLLDFLLGNFSGIPSLVGVGRGRNFHDLEPSSWSLDVKFSAGKGLGPSFGAFEPKLLY